MTGLKLPALANNKPPTQLSKADLQTMIANSTQAVSTVGGPGGGLPLLIFRARENEWNWNRQAVEPEDLGLAIIDYTQISKGIVEWINKKPRQAKFATIVSGKEITEEDLDKELDRPAYRKENDGPAVTFQMVGVFFDTGEPFRHENSSRGLAGAVRDLVKECAAVTEMMGEIMHPVVSLGSDSYNHAEFGKTYVPTFTIAGYISATVAAKGEISDKAMISAADVEARMAKHKKKTGQDDKGTTAKGKAGAAANPKAKGRKR